MREQITTTLETDVIRILEDYKHNSDRKIKANNTILEYLIRIFLGYTTPDDVLNNRMPEFFKHLTPVIKDSPINEQQENFEINTNDFDLL